MQEMQKSIYKIKPKEIILERKEAYHKGFAYYATKRVIDVVGSTVGLILLSPAFLITAIAIKVDTKGPIFYFQDRVGKNGKLFRMFKFRSMIVNAEDLLENLRDQNEMSGPMFKINNDPRITRLGRFIRKTSIDELPQIYNVLRGEMSGADLKGIRFIYGICRTWEKAILGLAKLKVIASYNSLNLICY